MSLQLDQGSFLSVVAAFQALFEKLIKGGSSEERKAAAEDVVTEMKQGGAASFAVSLAYRLLFNSFITCSLLLLGCHAGFLLDCDFAGWWGC